LIAGGGEQRPDAPGGAAWFSANTGEQHGVLLEAIDGIVRAIGRSQDDGVSDGEVLVVRVVLDGSVEFGQSPGRLAGEHRDPAQRSDCGSAPIGPHLALTVPLAMGAEVGKGVVSTPMQRVRKKVHRSVEIAGSFRHAGALYRVVHELEIRPDSGMELVRAPIGTD